MLRVDIELQFYGETEDEQEEIYKQLADTISKVVELAEISVGTLVKTQIIESR